MGENSQNTNDNQDANNDQNTNDNKDANNDQNINDNQIDDILSNLKLEGEEAKLLKTNKNLLSAVSHAILQKRDANNEAKKYREKIAKIEADNKKKEDEDLAKKGEFEKLYKDSQATIEAKEKKIRELNIDSQLKLKATEKGIKKSEYIKLFDKSNLKIDEDGNIVNIDTEFDTFFKNNTDLFKSASDNRILPDGTPPGTGNVKDINLAELKEKATKSGKTQDLAQYLSLSRQTKNN